MASNFTPANLPGELRDIDADDVGAANLAVSFIASECWIDFAAWCLKFHGVIPDHNRMLLVLGRMDRLFTALMEDDAYHVYVE